MKALKPILSALRLAPIDTATAEGRSRERYRRALFTSGTAAAAKAMSFLATLVTIPLVLGYLGPERFGLWAVITSLVLLLSFADFGIGNGLLTATAHASGKDDVSAVRRDTASAMVSLSVIASFFLLAFALLYGVVDWAGIFRVQSVEAAKEIGPAIAAFACCLALNMPASVASRLQMGLQWGVLSNLWQLAGTVVGVVALFIAIGQQAGLPILVAAFLGGPLLAAIANSIVFFGVMRRDLCPSLPQADWDSSKRLLALGGLFFVLQLANAVALWSDQLVITRLLGPEAVAQYAIPAKLFSVTTVAATVLLTPLWAAYGEAIGRGDSGWVVRTFLRSISFTVGGATIAAVFLWLSFEKIVQIWLGTQIVIPTLLLTGLALWSIVEAAGMSVAILLNGAGAVMPQVLVAIAFAALSITARVYLVGQVGIAGVPFGAVLAFMLSALVPYGIVVTQVLKSLAKPTKIG